MYFITILFDIQFYDFASRTTSRYYNFFLGDTKSEHKLALEG